MNRKTVVAVATLIALVFLAGASPAPGIAEVRTGDTAAPNLQQPQPLDVNIWLSQVDSTDPVHRLDPGTSVAQIVIQSNLSGGQGEPSRFHAEVWDANGIRVFQSDTIQLPVGTHTETIVITGTAMFGAYTSYVDSEKANLQDTVAGAVSDANKTNPSASQVRNGIQDTLAIADRLSNGVGRLRAFDLSSDDGADAAFEAAETALGSVSDRGNEALDLLNDEPINWDDVRAKLQAMQTEADDAASQIDAGLAAVDPNAERSFPLTGVVGRCSQNSLPLRVAGSDSVSDDFWWTVGTPGAPERLANPEQPTSLGSLRARPTRIYSTQVDVADAPHSTTVEALALDALCVPVPGVSVNFSTPADSIVTVESPQVTTDANGVAEVTVDATGDLGNGAATVNATVDSATASVGLTVIGPPASLQLRLGGSETQRTPYYGVESTVQVSAVVKDTNGNDVADGTPVQFAINPPDHSFTDSGQVTTAGGQASATLIFGSATGEYTIGAESGEASDTQPIRVVGNPAQVEVTADPGIISVSPIPDQSSSQLTVTVRDNEGEWAPDNTIVEFELVNPEDADWAYFTLSPDRFGHYLTPITEGKAVTSLVGRTTSSSDPNQTLWYREVTVRVTATYTVSGEVRASVSNEVTVILRGQTVFLPLINRK